MAQRHSVTKRNRRPMKASRNRTAAKRIAATMAEIRLLERVAVVLSEADSKVFVDALLNPPEPNETLRKAMATHTGPDEDE